MSSSLHLWSYYGLRSQVWLYRLLGHLDRRPAHLLVRREWLTGRPVEEFSWPAARLHWFPGHALPARLAAKLVPYVRSGNRNALNALDARFVRDLIRRIGARVLHVHFGWLAAVCPSWCRCMGRTSFGRTARICASSNGSCAGGIGSW